MSLIRNRHPRGMSTGGQFAPDLHDEPAVHLGAPAPARFSRFEDRPARKRRGAVAARAAVAALVLAASASLTGCGASNGSDCPSAAVYDAPAASTAAYISPAAAAAFTVSPAVEVPAKGGGGGGGVGHGSGHSSAGHDSGAGSHESTSGGAKGDTGWAPHIWPFTGHSSTCPSPAAKHA